MASMLERIGTRAKLGAAAGILLLKVVLGAWAAIALLTASSTDHKSFLGETIRSKNTGIGLLLLALAAITVVIVVQLMRLRPWARSAAIVLEIAAIVLALTRIASATLPALVSIVLSAAVIALVVGASSSD